MIKVVIDTNLLINGSQDDYNYGNRIVDEVIGGGIQAYANRATLKENRLIAGKKIADKNYLRKLEDYFSKVHLVETLSERLGVVEDPEDDKLLESAVASGAEYLISSDQHLLKLEKFQKVKIVTPGQFWLTFQEDSGAAWDQWKELFIQE